MNNPQGLPQEVVENILKNLVYTDALTLPNKDEISEFIRTCPNEWQQYFIDKYVIPLKDHNNTYISVNKALSYLIPNNGKVLEQIKYISTSKNKKSKNIYSVKK
jgi:cytochrome oxidase Cu insertion factor (SCO1/SenC/PrrC family)